MQHAVIRGELEFGGSMRATPEPVDWRGRELPSIKQIYSIVGSKNDRRETARVYREDSWEEVRLCALPKMEGDKVGVGWKYK